MWNDPHYSRLNLCIKIFHLLILSYLHSSPQFSPDGSPWGGDENANNHRQSLKMEQDEALGQHSTIAAVLYANMNHPELKQEFPSEYIGCLLRLY